MVGRCVGDVCELCYSRVGDVWEMCGSCVGAAGACAHAHGPHAAWGAGRWLGCFCWDSPWPLGSGLGSMYAILIMLFKILETVVDVCMTVVERHICFSGILSWFNTPLRNSLLIQHAL
eukprot:351144-Chlamydomonas_euryale.AAC.2